MKTTDLFGRSLKSGQRSVLGKRFRWPPFSVLNAREGDWQDRKRSWISLGIRSELGRGEQLTVNDPDLNDLDRHAAANGTRPPDAKDFASGGPGELSAEMRRRGTRADGLIFATGPSTQQLAERRGYTNGSGRRADAASYAGIRPPNASEKTQGLARDKNGELVSSKSYHAQPGGGPSKKSVWLGSGGQPVGGDGAINAHQSASLEGGLTFGTSVHPYDGQDGGVASQTGTSIFDPVLCELFYRWFTPARGLVLDPWCGGSVRGVVASVLGRTYVGMDLRPEQVDANERQAEIICSDDDAPIWLVGDSRGIAETVRSITNTQFDSLFSCPPYFDLELYSDDVRDLSSMTWEGFCGAYQDIIFQSCSLLREDCFAGIVIGDVRDRMGHYRSLPAVTTRYFEEAGLKLYNQIVITTAVGSLPLRAGRQFSATRKVGNTHQYLLVFVKGDARRAAQSCESVEFLASDVPVSKKSKEAVVGSTEPNNEIM